MTHFSLLELTRQIKKSLDDTLDPSYWVVAEIAQLNLHPKGHCYLELVQKDGEQIVAKMKATIWSYTYQNLHHWFERITGASLKEGMKILVNAEVQFHETYGLSLSIRDIDANYTLGERQKIREQVLRKLKEEGLIDRNRSLPLPLVPQQIAVVSSHHSAGLQDFERQLTLSDYSVDLTLFPAEMQGEAATRSMVDALKKIFHDPREFDLTVIIRGGGAQPDLDCFNTYLMGKAVARFPTPVITGIGHERDDTVVDTVARVKLKTPTAVAEFIISGIRNYLDAISGLYERIIGRTQHDLVAKKYQLQENSSRIKHNSQQILEVKKSQLQYINHRLRSGWLHKQSSSAETIRSMVERIKTITLNCINASDKKIEAYEKYFRLSDPDYTLQRGFTYTTANGRLLSMDNKPHKGDVLTTQGADLKVKSIVEDIISDG